MEQSASTTFSQKMQRLEAIVDQLDKPELELEQGLALLEEGLALHQQCQAILTSSQAKITELLNHNKADQEHPMLTPEAAPEVHPDQESLPF